MKEIEITQIQVEFIKVLLSFGFTDQDFSLLSEPESHDALTVNLAKALHHARSGKKARDDLAQQSG